MLDPALASLSFWPYLSPSLFTSIALLHETLLLYQIKTNSSNYDFALSIILCQRVLFVLVSVDYSKTIQ